MPSGRIAWSQAERMAESERKIVATPTTRTGAAVRVLRIGAGLTQVQLAERLQVDHCYVARIESGQRIPSLGVLARLAAVLGGEP